MIKVKLYENAITVDGHGRRDVCAAVSATMQTALAYFTVMGYRLSDITDLYEDHGGHMVIYTDNIKDRQMILALTDILSAQADTWPDDIKIELMEDEYYEPED